MEVTKLLIMLSSESRVIRECTKDTNGLGEMTQKQKTVTIGSTLQQMKLVVPGRATDTACKR